MHCEQAETQLPRLLFGELEEPAKSELLTHLGDCKTCAAQFGDLKVVTQLVKDGLKSAPKPVLSPKRREALLKAVSKPSTPNRKSSARPPIITNRNLGIAASVLVAGVGVAGMLTTESQGEYYNNQHRWAAREKSLYDKIHGGLFGWLSMGEREPAHSASPPPASIAPSANMPDVSADPDIGRQIQFGSSYFIKDAELAGKPPAAPPVGAVSDRDSDRTAAASKQPAPGWTLGVDAGPDAGRGTLAGGSLQPPAPASPDQTSRQAQPPASQSPVAPVVVKGPEPAAPPEAKGTLDKGLATGPDAGRGTLVGGPNSLQPPAPASKSPAASAPPPAAAPVGAVSDRDSDVRKLEEANEALQERLEAARGDTDDLKRQFSELAQRHGEVVDQLKAQVRRPERYAEMPKQPWPEGMQGVDAGLRPAEAAGATAAQAGPDAGRGRLAGGSLQPPAPASPDQTSRQAQPPASQLPVAPVVVKGPEPVAPPEEKGTLDKGLATGPEAGRGTRVGGSVQPPAPASPDQASVHAHTPASKSPPPPVAAVMKSPGPVAKAPGGGVAIEPQTPNPEPKTEQVVDFNERSGENEPGFMTNENNRAEKGGPEGVTNESARAEDYDLRFRTLNTFKTGPDIGGTHVNEGGIPGYILGDRLANRGGLEGASADFRGLDPAPPAEAEPAADRMLVELDETKLQLEATRKELGEIQRRADKIAREKEKQQYVIEQLIREGIPVTSIAAREAPSLNGKVLAVSDEFNVAVVSLGKDDGVKPGHNFTVFRDDTFVGKGVVEKVERDWAVVKVDPALAKEKMRVGDDVASSLTIAGAGGTAGGAAEKGVEFRDLDTATAPLADPDKNAPPPAEAALRGAGLPSRPEGDVRAAQESRPSEKRASDDAWSTRLAEAVRGKRVDQQERAALAENFRRLANRYFQNLEFEKAEESVRRALETNPTDREARALADRIAITQGNGRPGGEYAQQLVDETVVRVQETQAEIDKHLERAKRLIADAQDPAEGSRHPETSADAGAPQKNLEAAEKELRGTLERMEWLPNQADLSSRKQQTQALLDKVREARAGVHGGPVADYRPSEPQTTSGLRITLSAADPAASILTLHDARDLLSKTTDNPGPTIELRPPAGGTLGEGLAAGPDAGRGTLDAGTKSLQPPDPASTDRTRIQAQSPASNVGGLAGAAFTLDEPLSARINEDRIERVIKENVRPGTWNQGDRALSITPNQQVLVNAPADIQREVREFLGKLRQGAVGGASSPDRATGSRQDAAPTGDQLARRLDTAFDLAKREFERGNYEDTIQLLDKTLYMNPNLKEAFELQRIARRANHAKNQKVDTTPYTEDWKRTFDSIDRKAAVQGAVAVAPDHYDWYGVQQRRPRGITQLDAPTTPALELYDVQDLTAQPRNFPGTGIDLNTPALRIETPAPSGMLVDRVKEIVGREAFQQPGASLEFNNGLLVARGTPDIQRRVQEAVERVRKERVGGVSDLSRAGSRDPDRATANRGQETAPTVLRLTPDEAKQLEDAARAKAMAAAGGDAAVRAAQASRPSEGDAAADRDQKVAPTRDAIKSKLDTLKIDLDFQEAGLADIIDFIRESAGFNIDIDQAVRSNAGIMDKKISFKVKDLALGNVLQLLMSQYGLEFKVEEKLLRVHGAGSGDEAGRDQKVAPTEVETAAVFKNYPVNPWVMTARDPQSTFALDVDTASYAVARNYINKGFLPPAGAIRMEEFVNAFDYQYPCVRDAAETSRGDLPRSPGQTDRPGGGGTPPIGREAFSIHAEAAPAPFGEGLTLLKIGVQGRVIGREARKPAHLVFVVDASGSMARPDRLPLIQHAIGRLAGQLGPRDRVSLVTYGTQPRLVLEGTSAFAEASADKPAAAARRIVDAVHAIEPSGSTNLLAGLELGYATARRLFRSGEVNRVILCSDGVANIGQTVPEEMLAQVDAHRRHGITLLAVGVGHGAYNDALLETLADRGDGSYVFIDSREAAERVFVGEMAATREVIAKDAKIQVEFDPAVVRRYRLIGYENRDIADKDFRNDAVDAGEVGDGQSSTALYELELADPNPGRAAPWRGPAGQEADGRRQTAGGRRQEADGRWQTADDRWQAADGRQQGGDLGVVYVRYRDAESGKIVELASRIAGDAVRARTPAESPRFYLAACAAEFAEALRESEHASGGSISAVQRVLEAVVVQLPLDGKARELLELVKRAQGLPRAR